MVIEISRVLIQKPGIKSPIKIDLVNPCSIKSLIEVLELDNMGYAVFFVNGREVKKDYIVNNDDKLNMLPIFGGG